MPELFGFDQTFLKQVAIGAVTAAGSVFAAYWTYSVSKKREDTNHWQALNSSQQAHFDKLSAAQLNFQKSIEVDLTSAKEENQTLRAKIIELEKRVSTLVDLNEKLMFDRIEWMQKALGLQAVLQRYEQADKPPTKAELAVIEKDITDLEESQ